MKKQLLFISLLLCFSFELLSKEKITEEPKINASNLMKQTQQLSFHENKGQMKDVEGKATPYVLYKAEAPGINIWVTTTGLTYQFIKAEENKESREKNQESREDISLSWNRVDMIFKNASIKKENCITEENNQIKTVAFNYYLENCPDGIFDVKSFSKITIKNIYEGIDWVLYTNSQQNFLKQDFIVHPNADANQIKIIYEGNGKFEAINNQIHFENSIGELQEGKLFCYQGSETNEIASNYIVKKNEGVTNSGAGNFIENQESRIKNQDKKNNSQQELTTNNYQLTTNIFSYEVSIQLNNYDKSKPLTIDPQLVWGTFYGGSTFEGAYGIATDNNGNVFITGYTGSIDFPVLNGGAGSFNQPANAGGVIYSKDIIIMKFSNTSVHQWTTYYGGSGDEEAYSICTDPTGNIFIAGYTASGNFPLANPGGGAYYQNAYNNGEAIILKFGNTGNRIWATLYGGANSNEEAQSIATDATGNVYVTGYTNSNNFPVFNPGGVFFQGASAGGTVFAEAFILKFSNAGARLWATYYGGTADDDGFSITTDLNGNIYVTGYTKSINFPTTNPGGGAYFQAAKSGAANFTDAFILKFDNTNNILWSTYYGGSFDDVGNTVRTDGLGNVFILGSTNSNNIPLYNPGGGAYNQAALGSGGLDDAFIFKCSNTSAPVWATYFGGNNVESYELSTTNLAIDNCNNIFICFTTQSPNVPTKAACDAGFLDNTLTGPMGRTDQFISKFSNGGVHLWGTYAAGEGDDFRSAIALDRSNNLFLTGEWCFTTQNNSYPLASPGGGGYYDPTYNFASPDNGYDDVFVVKFKPTVVSANATFTNSNCCTGTATLNGTGGCAPYQYLWYDATWNLVANSQIATKLCGGVYHGVLRDSLSCSLGDTSTVTIVELGILPNISTGPTQNLSCLPNATVVITAGSTTPGVTFSWAGAGIVSGGNTNSATVNAAGTYTVTVDDGTGCTVTATVIVTQTNPLPNITAGAPITLTCTTTSGTITASSTTGGVNYNWTGPGIVSGNTNDTATINAPGTYTVMVTDGSGCTNTATVIVNIDTISPNLTPGLPTTLYCNPIQGIVTASSTTAGATYSWTGTGIVSGNTNDTATVNAAGTYTVTVTNPLTGCTKTTTVIVTSNTTPPNLTPGPTLTATSCINVSGTISASSTTPGATYSWAGPGIASGGTTANPTINALGTYTVTVTDPNTGCTSTATVLVNTSTTLPNLTAGPTLTSTSCINVTGNISATSTTPGVTYNWSGPGIVSGGTTNNPAVNATGTYTVTVTDPITGCTNTATVLVNSNPVLPTVTPGPTLTSTSCINVSGSISASSTTPGVTYNWTGPGIASGGTTANPSVNALGTYTVTVTDPITGCTNTATVLVNSNPVLPTVSATPATIHCNQSTGIITASSATSGATYLWSGPGIVSGGNTNAATVNAFGVYTVIVTDPVTGCTNSTTTFVAPTPPPIANVSGNVIIIKGDSTQLAASGGVSYVWFQSTGLGSTTGNTVMAGPFETTTYCVEVTDNNGCKDTACVTVFVEIPCPTNENLQIPNAFSPNKDGLNEEFCLMGWEVCLEEFQVLIFDRWGEKVYESKDPNFCWDGYYRNSIMDAQVFVYYIKARFTNIDKPIVKKGNVSLLR